MENSRAKPPPGVEEALSSMLWTPYPDDSSESSSSDESELGSFKRRKRPLTWAVNDNHEFTSAHPYSISSRLSYPSYYPPTYLPNQHLINNAPKTLLTHSHTDNSLSMMMCQQSAATVEQDHRTSIIDNGTNYQTHQQQSGFISFYNSNNNTNAITRTVTPNNSFHFSSFIGNSVRSSTTNDSNVNKENEHYCRSVNNMQSHRPSVHEPVLQDGGENEQSSLCANNQQTHEFSCVQSVDENRPNAGVAHRDYYSVIQEQQKKLNKFIVESTLGGCTGMRLNVPAVNMTTTTTIINNDSVSNCADNNNTHHFYVSSAASTAATTVLSDVTSAITSDNRNNSGQGSLTIPVNQQTSSVNIVNCYRTVPVQLVNTIQNDGDENRVKESPSNNNNRKINENNKCDIIEVVDDSSEKEKSSKLSSSIINISTIENINQIVSDKDDKDNKSNPKGALPFDTSKLEQSIYISSSDQTNVDAINSVHDPIIVQENVALSSPLPTSREQRRRERRERRAARNRMAHIHAIHSQVAASVNSNHIAAAAAAQIHQLSSHAILGSNQVRPVSTNFEIIPDLLHSHLPPPYTTLPLQPGATIIATPVPVPVSAVDNCRYSFPLPIIRRSPSERSGKGCCGQWFAFAGPPLRALIAVVALGGVACALGGAALGATSLAGPPQSHFTAALLMIGVGVILVTISGAAWKMTAPGGPPCLGLGTSADLGRCNRRACTRAGTNGHVIYPEFQHRAPPPSYQASMQEYRLRLLLLDRDRQSAVLRVASPPPTYRSASGSLLRTTATPRGNQSGHLSPSAASAGGLFSGISEIISGLSNSNNHTNNNNNVESISNNSSEATLPPSYRTRNNNRHTGTHLVRPMSAYNNDSNHDFTLAVRSSSMENLSAAVAQQHQPPLPPLSYHQPPSNSSSEQQQQPKNVNSSSQCTSINSSSCSSSNQNQIDRESISDSSKVRSNKKLLNNGNKSNNDLVTIVTISGFIDENENRKNINEVSSMPLLSTEEGTTEVCVLAQL